jgi:hypothetical protein
LARVVVLAVPLLAVLVAATAMRRTPASTAAPRDEAVAACRTLRAAFDGVRRNHAAPDVLALLQESRDRAARAARIELRWGTLAAAIQTVQRGLNDNDEEAASAGRAVAADECASLGVALYPSAAR